MPCAIGVGTSHPHTERQSILFPELECLLQRSLQHTGTVRGRPGRGVSNLVSQESDRFRVIEVRSEEVPLHIHELLLAERSRKVSAIQFTIEKTTKPTLQ